MLDRFLFSAGLQQSYTEVIGDESGQTLIFLQVVEHFDSLTRSAGRHINVRPQKLDIVLYLFGNGTVDPFERLQRIIELILLEMNAGQPERSFVSYGIIDGAFEHPLDGAPSAVVHAVVELEISDREFGVVDVIVKGIEFGLV